MTSEAITTLARETAEKAFTAYDTTGFGAAVHVIASALASVAQERDDAPTQQRNRWQQGRITELEAECERLRAELAQAQRDIEGLINSHMKHDAHFEAVCRADERRKTLDEVERLWVNAYSAGLFYEALRRLRDLPPGPLRCQTCGEGRTHPNHAPTGLFRHDFWPQGVYR